MIKRTFKKKVAMVLTTSFILNSILGVNFGVTNAYAATLPGAHHAVVGNDVFLGGNFIEVGMNKHGSFGTESDAPAGFHPSIRTNLGMVADGDGFNVGSESNTGDFFLPGNPYESYVVGYKDADGTITKAQVAERNHVLGITNISTTDTSSGNTLSATTVGTTDDGKLEITQVVSFDVNDKYFNIHVTYRNLSEDTLYDARYLRSVDPDQDADTKSNCASKNSVIKNPPQDDSAIVIAKGATTNEPFIYMASDSRARASVTRMTDPYNTACYNVDGSTLLAAETTYDTWIAMTYALGDIAPGGSVSLDLKNSLNPDINEALAEVQPTITTPAAVEITRADDTLTSELKKEDGSKFTTSAGVTYDWYRDEELVQEGTDYTYTISNADKGKDIKLKVTYGEVRLTSNIVAIANDEIQVTTPAAVRIKGTEKVGNTLTAQFLTENASDFTITTPSSVSYKWYRLDSLNSESSKLVGQNNTYELVSSDAGKYIKLLACYGDDEFYDTTSKIENKSLSSSSSSSSSNQTTSTKQLDGWKNNSQDWKYIKNGQSVTGWNQIEGSWYLMDSTGTRQTGWKQTNGTWYLLNNDGVMATGWQQTNNTWYFLKDSGAMVTGWLQSNGTWYLLKNDGAMATGWQQVNGKWYYLNSNGSMAYDTIIDGYKLDENGAWISNP